MHFQIKGKRGYVPSGLVREYKVLKSSLEFLVNTEESENVSDSSQERVTDKSLKNASNSVNIHETSNLETILNDVEHSGLEPDPGSGIRTSTPSLDDSAISNLPVTDVRHSPFFGSSVSAEPIESEKPPNPEGTRQPFEVVDGTTLYHETDGKQTESNLHLPRVQPTSTTSSSLPSVVPEMKSKSDDETASVPPFQLSEPSVSAGDGGGDSAENVALEGQLLEKKEEATVVKVDHESDERKTESISVVDKKETDSVTGRELTSVEEHKQEAEYVEHKYISSVDVTNSKTKVIDDKKEEIIEEPHMAPDRESEENEEDDKEEDEEDEYDDEDEDIEDEVNVEVAQLPSTGTNDQKLVEAVNTVDGPTKPADSEVLKVEDQGIVQPTLETDTNMNSVFINNSKVDDLNLQENAEVPLVQVQLPENITDSYRPSKEVATNEPSILEHPSLPAAERQDAYDNANQTESSVGSVEELESSQIRKMHESVTEGEGSGTNEHLETKQAVADTGDQLHSLAGDDKPVEGKEVIDDSSKVIRSVPGSDYPEYISGSLKTQFGTVHPEHAVDRIADYNSELSSELKGEVKSNLSEEPYADSTQEEIAATTAASSEEEYYGVPIYGYSAEEPSATVPTSISEEPLVPVEGSDLVSKKPSGGLLSGIMDTLSAGIGVLTSMFGGSSADSHIAEVPEVNESKPNVVTESFTHKDQIEDMNTKRDGGWSSPWGDPDRGHIVTGSGNDNLNEEKERMCKLNSFNLYLLHSFIKNL